MNLEPIQYIEIFLSEIDVLEISKRQYKFNLQRFFRWVKHHGILPEELKRSDIINYKNSLTLEGKTTLTIANYMTTIRLFYKWMDENNYAPDITTSIRITKEYKTFRKKSLTAMQARHFLSCFQTKTLINKRDYAIANLMLRNGLREIEVSRMNVEDIIDHNGTRAIRVQRKGKKEKNSIIPLSGKAMEAIESYLLSLPVNWKETDPLFISLSHRKFNHRLETNWISQMIKSKLIQSGFNDSKYTAHSLRHSTASILIASGVSEYDVQNIMGHSSFQITQIYTREKDNDIMFQRNIPKELDKAI